jgi:hypothetical protein
MPVLEKDLRNKLERTVKDARNIAELAARSALKQLGVENSDPPPHLGEEGKELWDKLRIHAHQLGDDRNTKTGEQAIDRLIEETAYQHWHRMLFARFLAENNLLMYGDLDNPVAITLEECEDLAKDEGLADGWELAAKYAGKMLPRIFRVDSPVFQLTLPPENQQELESLIAALPAEVFTASDSLGWVYQFWQSRRKDEINNSEVKIGARELPAVTQLFTEPYMVSFLLDNSLGAWWAAKVLNSEDFRDAASEAELRRKAALPGAPLDYLRFVKDEKGVWTPAAGTFDSWPDSLKDLKTLDPCCGSGHFLVAALQMLAGIRMKLEGLSAAEAIDAVLRDNIHGLELDQRCVELAAFNLAFAAWTYPNAGGYRQLPELQVACSGLSVGVSKDDWVNLAKGKKNLTLILEMMYDYFKDAPVLGSLLNPSQFKAFESWVDWNDIEAVFEKALNLEGTTEWHEAAIVAQGITRAGKLLSGKYHWIITNVPYLARGKQGDVLKNFSENYYSKAKNDLATVFLERCLEFCVKGGTVNIVLPQNWLFLTSYKHLREKLLKAETWQLIARLGPGAFETISGEVVKAILIAIGRDNKHTNREGLFQSSKKGQIIRGLDVSGINSPIEKALELIGGEIKNVEQSKQLENPDARIIFNDIVKNVLLGRFVDVPQGIKTGDDNKYRQYYWELQDKKDWKYYQSTPDNTQNIKFSGLSNILRWENDGAELARRQGESAWGKPGVAISQMTNMPAAYYSGEIQDSNINVVIPKDDIYLLPITSYCISDDFKRAVRNLDQKLSVTNATLIKVPFDLDHWTKVAAEKYPHGLPKPYSDDPTQWIFHGHPCGSVIWDEETKRTAHGPLRYDETVLHVAVARLLGYRWPAELDTAMELAGEQREWVNRCETLIPFAGNDGIVCIPPLRGEQSAADRLINLLAASYGGEWSAMTLAKLLNSAGYGGKTLEDWLKENFFAQHCKLFRHRPFIWHIWDGLKDGFAVLVNYHKLDRKLLETLIYTYLEDWISRRKQDLGEPGGQADGAQEKLDAAEALKKKLELILLGENPYDIFVRWKPLEEQPIGWEPDLNDGVRLNIRPFMKAGDVKIRGAGVLRDKPNVGWDKDRGKDAASAPWYKLGLQYGGNEGDRINDHHLSLEAKRKARGK